MQSVTVDCVIVIGLLSSGVVSGTTVRALVPGRFGQKKIKTINLKDTAKEQKKYFKLYRGVGALGRYVCFLAAFAQLGPVSSISLGQFFLVRVKRNVTLLSVSICPTVSSILGVLFKKEWSYG